MNLIIASGLRGGVGTTSLLAMLGDALQAMGESVLMTDLDPSDALRLHFNVPYSDHHGWAAARTKHEPWQEHVFFLQEGQWLLPYGRHGMPVGSSTQVHHQSLDAFWAGVVDELAPRVDWLLIDSRAVDLEATGLVKRAAHHFLVATLDAGAHILLNQCAVSGVTKIVVNMYDPARQLSNDLLLDWRYRYAKRLLPVLMYRDENVHEALAQKTTATRRYPQCTGAADASALATWCLAQRGLG